jgi:hypothetical protein
MGILEMPSPLVDALLSIGQMMSYSPLVALFFYLLVYHGQEEKSLGGWL